MYSIRIYKVTVIQWTGVDNIQNKYTVSEKNENGAKMQQNNF